MHSGFGLQVEGVGEVDDVAGSLGSQGMEGNRAFMRELAVSN